MALRISRAVPYFCGLPFQKRMARRIVTLDDYRTCYVDDSGGDGRSAVFFLGAWVTRVGVWERFSDAWDLLLNAPRPLKKHKGKQYFRHTDVITRTACFKGFTEQEAAHKTVSLAGLLIAIRADVVGFRVNIPLADFTELVQDKAIVVRNKIHLSQRNPLYLALMHLIPAIYISQHQLGVRDVIDIIVDGDKTDKALSDMRIIFNNAKQSFQSQPWYPLLGDMYPRSAKDLAPLQASDMLAGQTRKGLMDKQEAPITRYWREGKVPIWATTVNRSTMKKWSEQMNEALSTDRLIAITDKGKPQVISKRRVKKKK